MLSVLLQKIKSSLKFFCEIVEMNTIYDIIYLIMPNIDKYTL